MHNVAGTTKFVYLGLSSAFSGQSIFTYKRLGKSAGLILPAVLCLLVISSMTGSATFAQSGGLDPSFGTGGKVSTDLGLAASDYGEIVLVQPDGKIIVAGTSWRHISNTTPNTPRAGAVRYNTNGTLDTSYGNGGIVLLTSLATPIVIHAGVLQADGKLLLVGQYGAEPGYNAEYLVARINTNGTLDMSFDSDGYALRGFGANIDHAYGIVVRTDGKIVVAGESVTPGVPGQSVLLVRFNSDGSIDTSFGAGGETYVISPVNAYRDLTLLPDGKMLALHGGTAYNFSVTRYNADGSLDPSFGTNGVANLDIGANDTATDLALQPDGKIVVGGITSFEVLGVPDVDFALARFNSNGSVDTGFGAGGKVTTPFSAGYADSAYAVTILPDGRIVQGGHTSGPTPQLNNFALARFYANGSLAGKTTTDFSGRWDSCLALGVQPDGKLVASGTTNALDHNTGDIAVARYLDIVPSSNAVYFDFDNDSIADIGVYRPGATAGADSHWYMVSSRDNLIIAAQFGSGGDRIVPADFDGDGATNIAVWRPSTGIWYTSRNPASNYGAVQWGQTGDIPIPGDFDGDGKADHVVFRPSNGVWFVRRSSDGGLTFQQFGTSASKPLQGDFDGDRKADFAYVEASGGDLIWNIRHSSTGLTFTTQFGQATDRAVPADYDGNGSANIVVFRPSTGRWYTSPDPSTNYGEVLWGQNGDIPAPADYDGDFKADLTVFRPSNRVWYILRSSNGTLLGRQWGLATDLPVESAFIP